ncbi:hypothetical protein CHS0354_029189 [Potamilus streckersoni]|uniref:Regulating synaptic membrane exocytosis protein 2 n=1 Tax=Potamilus streckersoni TaxID=2493646 RepID=A0AAE0TG17_9BIVA|nr:hypothetical protein CHS0354_029189 [Potamilus streckersoni]
MASIMKKVLHPGSWRQNSRKSNILSPPGAANPVCPPSPDLTGLTPEEINILKDVFKRQELFEVEEQERQRKLAEELQRFQEQNVKGKWICNMCLMKRELLAKTGTWYHGPNAQPSINSHSFCKKLSFSEIESSENDGTGTEATFSEGTQTQALTDYDYPSLDLGLRNPRSPIKRSRRYHSFDDRDPIEPDEDVEIDDEQFYKERQICRRQRYSRKNRRCRTSTNSYSEKDGDSYDLKEADVKVVLKYPNEENFWLSYPDSKVENQNVLYLSSDSVPLFTESSASDSRRVSWESTCTESSGQRRSSREDYEVYSDESGHGRQVCDLNVSEIKRQDALYFSSSSSILSDTKCSDIQGYSSPSPVSNVSKLDTSPPRSSESRIKSEKIMKKKLLPYQSRFDDVRERSHAQINSLSPDVALSCHQRRRRRRSPKLTSEAECQKGERERRSYYHPSQDYNEILKAQMERQELGVNSHGRRMTLSHCENIQLHPIERRMSSGNVTNPRQVILHRDRSDKSHRTAGLGMRVVGGKIGSDGLTGAYVTMVTENGPAYVQGIRSGDQVLQWDGRSLNDVTFEEVNEIKNKSGSIVQILVFRHHNEIAQAKQERINYPVIIRSETVDVKDPQPSDGLVLNKPKRRLLPKTPIEIKRDVKQINGKIWLQIHYDTKCLAVTLVKGESLLSAEGDERRGTNPVVMLHLLPSRNVHESKETKPKFDTTDPEWNETFVFPNITEDEVRKKSLEITLWNMKEIEDEFIGEVLLDLSESIIDGTLVCYNLEDHDENSSPLPYRKKSFSISDTSAFTSFDDSSLATTPNLNPSPRSSIEGQRTSPHIMPLISAHEKMRELMGQFKSSPGREFSSNHSSPVLSPTSPTDQSPPLLKSGSFKSLVKKKMSSAMARMSSSINLGSDKKEHSVSYPNITRCSSYHDVFDNKTLDVIIQRSRKSFESAVGNYDLLAPPHPLSISNSSSDFFLEMDQESEPGKCPNPDHPVPEGSDITSLLGPGQLPPKPSYEIQICGDIKMGFMVSKGKLEVDIVVVKGLSKSGISTPPDTYVKTYLVEGMKTLQKKKTQMVKASFDPVFKKKIKYSACNIHGRCIKVNVWEKQRTFDKKNCLGEAVVKLDDLNLSHFNLAWYKLFQMGAMDIGSSESLYFW